MQIQIVGYFSRSFIHYHISNCFRKKLVDARPQQQFPVSNVTSIMYANAKYYVCFIAFVNRSRLLIEFVGSAELNKTYIYMCIWILVADKSAFNIGQWIALHKLKHIQHRHEYYWVIVNISVIVKCSIKQNSVWLKSSIRCRNRR